MACMDHTRAPRHAGRLPLLRMLAEAPSAFGRWHQLRKTRRILAGLPDRTLEDIGLTRAEIERIFRRTTRG